MYFYCGELSSLSVLKQKAYCKKLFFIHIFVRDVYYQMHLNKCKRNRGLSARKIVKNQCLKTRMKYWSNSSMTKVDPSKKRWFGICGILKKSLKSSENSTHPRYSKGWLSKLTRRSYGWILSMIIESTSKLILDSL